MDVKTPMIDLAAQIVAAYVTKNAVEQADLPRLIGDVHRALEHAATGVTAKDEAEAAVDIELVGANTMGNHVTGTVRVRLPRAAGGAR